MLYSSAYPALGEAAWETQILLRGLLVGCIAKKHECHDEPGAVALLDFWLGIPCILIPKIVITAWGKPAAAVVANPSGDYLL